jgi:hypothetical protein
MYTSRCFVSRSPQKSQPTRALTHPHRFPPFPNRLFTVYQPFFHPFSPFSRFSKMITSSPTVLNRLPNFIQAPAPAARNSTAGGDSIASARKTIAQRDHHGRFTSGCRPGPGRPRKLERRTLIDPFSLNQRLAEFFLSRGAWNNIVGQLGPKEAREFLADLEAQHGEICFRHVALAAIDTAEQAPSVPPKRSLKHSHKPAARLSARSRINRKAPSRSKSRTRRPNEQ